MFASPFAQAHSTSPEAARNPSRTTRPVRTPYAGNQATLRRLDSLVLRRKAQAADADCPGYEAGEEAKSKQQPGVLGMPVAELKPDELLVADFGVDWRHLKDATRDDPELHRWLHLAASDPKTTFVATGFTDCVGDEGNNDALRLGRARRVADLVREQTRLACTSEAAPHNATLGNNHTRVGRAMNRGVKVRIVRPAAPPKTPSPNLKPQSVIEMRELLDDAENMLVDPAMLNAAQRKRLYGTADLPAHPAPLPGQPPSWKPDTAGALQRVDAALAFVEPLVRSDNIKHHGAELLTPSNIRPGNITGDNLKTTFLGTYHDTNWLDKARLSFEEVRKARADGSVAPYDLVIKAKSLLASRSGEPLKVLADEGLSFELELGSSPRPAPEFRSDLHALAPTLPDLGKRELRVLAWLRTNKTLILDAERTYKVDRRAIAAAIAWEAMENIMAASPHSAGPGKMHTYKHDLAAVVPGFPKGDALPQQLEESGAVPKPADDDAREAILRMPQGSITYIAAAMHAAADIATQNGFDMSHDLVALTSFYQGYDLPKWKSHMEQKKASGEKTFVAVDPMPKWTQSHVAYLESAVGAPSP